MIMLNLLGKEWGSLTETQKTFMLNHAIPVSGIDGNTIQKGDCIVDFDNNICSIQGLMLEELIIQDDAIFYNPAL